MTLVEVMVAMTLLATMLAGFLATFIQSRRMTENSVMHAAATSLVYGIIEQMKGFSYNDLLPSKVVDDNQSGSDSFPGATAKAPPYVRVRINQDQVTWLQCNYTAAGGTSTAPTTTPSASATAVSLGVPDNTVGPLKLSSVSGATSQQLTLHLWLWIDEIPDATKDVSDVKRITLVYKYDYIDGRRTRTVIDREVFIRTLYDQ
jgi:hypothetical protein